MTMNDNETVRDVIVVGGGAAGLMAAASAGECGRDVLLLEKNSKLGVKILMSGGTRCNITHNCDSRGIAEAFGRQGKFLRSALATLTPEDVIQKIEALGVATKIEATGKIFPVSNKAIDVRDALVTMATAAGAQILSEQSVMQIERIERPSGDEPQFKITTDSTTFRARKLILTTGGQSYPGCGTTGDGYPWAEQFGHSIVTTVPALAPLICHQEWVHELKGITVEDAELSLWHAAQPAGKQKQKRKPLDTRRGPLLMTHFGFSGPTVMNLSRTVAQHEAAMRDASETTQLLMRCDFLPNVTEESLADRFRSQKQASGKQLSSQLLAKSFPRRLTEALMQQANIPVNQKNADLSKKQTSGLIDVLKRTEFLIPGTLGYTKAEVTSGGVSLKEVDSRNMQSKLQDGVFFAGEILDFDGPIGGFNFQAAFSTGWLAGQSIDSK